MILGVTAIICSLLLFHFIADSEGPNLFVISVAAFIVFGVSLVAYLTAISTTNKLLYAMCIQALLVTVSYFVLR